MRPATRRNRYIDYVWQEIERVLDTLDDTEADAGLADLITVRVHNALEALKLPESKERT